MSEVIKTFKYSKSWQYWSLIVLAIVIFMTVSFGAYDYFLKKEISQIKNQISEHRKSIEKLEGQKNVHVYSLIKTNQKVLDNLDERSHITKYMEHLTSMSEHYNFEVRWFQLVWDKLSTKVTFQDNELGLAYKKSARFISDYRTDETSLFDLNFIGSINSTDTDIKFSVDFTLK